MQRGARFRSRGGSNGRRGRNNGHGNSGSSQQMKGLFADGIWQCNCSPRLPAEHFKVKKEGPNKGRWFYTCQQSDPKRCGFFLWDEEAKPREEAAVLSNSRNEPVEKITKDSVARAPTTPGKDSMPNGKGMFAGVDRNHYHDDSSTPSPASSPTPVTPRSKRTAHDAGFSDQDDNFGWALSGQDEAELTKAVDTAVASTPNKAAKTGVYATPSTLSRKSSRRLPWDNAPVSPPTRSNNEPMTPATLSEKKTVADFFNSTPSKSKQTSFPALETPDSRPRVQFTNPTTPSAPISQAPADPPSPSPPTRHKNALQDPGDSRSTLTQDVLSALNSAPALPAKTLDQIRSLVSMHDLRAKGVAMGRDVARQALREKDARIVELEAKIARLEAERETSRSVIRQLKWSRENGEQSVGDLGIF